MSTQSLLPDFAWSAGPVFRSWSEKSFAFLLRVLMSRFGVKANAAAMRIPSGLSRRLKLSSRPSWGIVPPVCGSADFKRVSDNMDVSSTPITLATPESTGVTMIRAKVRL